MESKNRIPRNFKIIIATCISGNAEGCRMVITKDDGGYHGREIDTGRTWRLFPSHIRNPHVFEIESVEF